MTEMSFVRSPRNSQGGKKSNATNRIMTEMSDNRYLNLPGIDARPQALYPTSFDEIFFIFHPLLHYIPSTYIPFPLFSCLVSCLFKDS